MNKLPPMTLFDYMVSSRENNMLKAFLPYVDRDFQPMLATYIKFSELLATIDLFRPGRNVFDSQSASPDFTDIISNMLPYVSQKEREAFETISNIKNAMDMFETYKDMLSPDMMDAFTAFNNSEAFNSSEDDSSDENSSDKSHDAHVSNSSPSDDNSSDATFGNTDNMSDMLSSMLSPEQQLMFEQLSNMMGNS